MYKIINNKEEYNRQYEIIMSEYQSHFNLSNDNIICDKILHCSKDLGAFDLNRLDLFESLKETSSIINDEWLSIDIVNELPTDWMWDFITDTIRIIIPNYLILQDSNILNLISYIKTNNIHNIITKESVIVYVNYILPTHQTLFNKYSEIIIENL